MSSRSHKFLLANFPLGAGARLSAAIIVALFGSTLHGQLDPATQPSPPPDLSEMRGLMKLDPVQEADAAFKRKDIYFAGVYGFSVATPGIDIEEFVSPTDEVNYKYPIRGIQGTTDAPRSDEQERLTFASERWAWKFNRAMYAHLPTTRPAPERVGPEGFHQAVEAIRVTRNVPAVGILASEGGKVVVRDAWGEARTNDNWHIGSDTKAMTATIAAGLIEANRDNPKARIKWTATVADCCPELATKLPAAYQLITLEQLLTQTSGIADPAGGQWLNDMRALEADRAKPLGECREAILENVLQSPLAAKPGTKFIYANLNYILAGHMLETFDGYDWERMISSEWTENDLGIRSLDFGAPYRLQGHDAAGNAVTVDNPATLGPAGTVNLTLDDWLKFCEVHAGHGPKDFLSAESLTKLHAPVLNNYAMGWAVIPGADGTAVLTHDGSNTFWYARAVIRPSDDRILLITLNKADSKACDEITAAVVNALWSPKPANAPAK